MFVNGTFAYILAGADNRNLLVDKMAAHRRVALRGRSGKTNVVTRVDVGYVQGVVNRIGDDVKKYGANTADLASDGERLGVNFEDVVIRHRERHKATAIVAKVVEDAIEDSEPVLIIDTFERQFDEVEIKVQPVDQRIHHSLFLSPTHRDDIPDVSVIVDRCPYFCH